MSSDYEMPPFLQDAASIAIILVILFIIFVFTSLSS